MGTSAASPDPASGPAPESLTDKQARIYRYLRSRVDGRAYFKSRLIAEDLGLSAKEVGANMAAVDAAAGSFSVEKWGYSSGTTWMVTA